MKLAELVERLGGACPLQGSGPDILDVQLDSRRVGVGDLFAALPGEKADGARFLTDAAARGAVAVLTPHGLDLRTVTIDMPGLHLVQWTHRDARRVVGRAAALVHGRPADALSVVGVTGTNGKTTTAHVLGQLLERAGMRPAVLGTAGHRLAGGTVLPASHTTPDAPDLQRILERHLGAGGASVVMEVSSHALAQERTAGVPFRAGVFTNLSREHLDYHGDMASYARAKERLFEGLAPDAAAILNRDDPAWERMKDAAERSGARVLTYATRCRADLCATRLRAEAGGTRIVLAGMGVVPTELRLALRGRYNVENALAAAAAALWLGVEPAAILAGLAATRGAPGRLEPVDTDGRGFDVFVDYAHTPDALDRVLRVLREGLTGGRLIAVFGCGGDRDRGKRPLMGRTVAALADVAVVTSDNPRGEDPEGIVGEIVRGMGSSSIENIVEVDRRRAIRRALEIARPGDVVLVAGKGHEELQIVADRELRFDDREVVREVLA